MSTIQPYHLGGMGETPPAGRLNIYNDVILPIQEFPLWT